MTECILCDHGKTTVYHKTDTSTYLHCPNCNLVFVHPEERLPPAEEKVRYDLHENNPDDPRYRNFLNQLFEPLHKKLEPESYGLDYGSGPGPTLSVMFGEAGHRMDLFDPFYANDPSIFNHTYDFITSTETAEHFYNPRKEFNRLWKILKPGGYLGIMTKLRPKDEPFADWHYHKDDTHVTLYSEETFQWLANTMDAELTIIGERVLILKKGN